ncbi:MAG TPA: NCS2 family permease, partial [Actinomycetales bacterium]|nr:NCS2 family permease [Actinomycetales bacterium]
IILILVLTGFREAVFRAVPGQLKIAISVGIGLFIALVGFVNSGFVRPGVGTPLELGVGGFLAGWPTLVFVTGLALILILMVRKVRGAILIGIIVATVLAVVVESIGKIGEQSEENLTGWGMNVPALPDSVIQTPDFATLGQFSLFGSIEKLGIVTVILLVFTLMLADFFDTMGTMVAICAEAKLLDENGNPPRTKQILIIDSISAAAGGMAGVSSNTSYIESASGVGEGARTGFANLVTGVLFLLATFLTPLVQIVPYEAATPALVIVGFLMMSQVAEISWKDMSIAIPAFLTMVVMPFTYSISAGIGVGFLAYVILRIARGKVREVHPLMWIISALFVVYFAMDPVRNLLGI